MHAMTARVARATTMTTALVLAACTGTPDRRATGASAGAATSTAATSTAADSSSARAAAPARDTTRLTDANILAKEAAGDSAEVVIARLAQSRATSPAVRAYAAMLIADHSRSLGEVHALARQVAITPQAPVQDTTVQETAHVLERLRGTPKGTAFDTTFVNHEVEDHQHDIADAHSMRAAAQQAKVKALVEQSLPALQKHLDRAQQIAHTGARGS